MNLSEEKLNAGGCREMLPAEFFLFLRVVEMP